MFQHALVVACARRGKGEAVTNRSPASELRCGVTDKQERTDRSNHLLPGGAAAACLAFALLWWLFQDFTIDDVYIFLRYARNIAEGHGIRYNIGDPPTEGVSSILWTLMLSALMRAGVEPLAAAKTLGLIFGMSCVALTPLTVPQLRVGYRLLAAWLVALSAPMVIWSASGMGASFTAFYALIWILTVQRSDLTSRNCLLLGILSAGGILVRPEAALLWFAFVVFIIVRRDTERGRALLLAAAGAVAVWLPLELFRLAYFGYPLPAPFYAKAVQPGFEQHLRGIYYNYEFLIRYCGGPLALMAAVYALAARNGQGRQLRPAGLVVIAWLLWVVMVGDDWMPQFRFLVPAIPAIAATTAAVMERVSATLVRPRAVTMIMVAAVFALLFASQGAGMWLARNTNRHYSGYRMQLSYHIRALDSLRSQGLYLRENAAPGAVVAAYDIGIVGFISEAKIIDMWGLTDYEMATLSSPERVSRVSKLKPDYWQVPWAHEQSYPGLLSHYQRVEGDRWGLHERVE
jgi:arabinofuranosyltransferase